MTRPLVPGIARVTNPEDPTPIHMLPYGHLTLAKAKRISAELHDAINAVNKHFACPVTREWPASDGSSGVRLAPGFKPTIFTCNSRGSVKINDKWYCKKHAKALTAPPKLTPAERRAARKIEAQDAERRLLA